jgi:hypothetical protein
LRKVSRTWTTFLKVLKRAPRSKKSPSWARNSTSLGWRHRESKAKTVMGRSHNMLLNMSSLNKARSNKRDQASNLHCL